MLHTGLSHPCKVVQGKKDYQHIPFQSWVENSFEVKSQENGMCIFSAYYTQTKMLPICRDGLGWNLRTTDKRDLRNTLVMQQKLSQP